MDQFKLVPETVEILKQGTFKTPYFMVYGTLRATAGNFMYYLKDKVEHLGTFEVSKFKMHSYISAGHTGNEQDHLVVDLFKVKEEHLDVCNTEVDDLEGVRSHYRYVDDNGVRNSFGYVPAKVTFKEFPGAEFKFYDTVPYTGFTSDSHPDYFAYKENGTVENMARFFSERPQWEKAAAYYNAKLASLNTTTVNENETADIQ